MPLHDWGSVPDNVFHNFHLGWLWNLAGALNASVLPPGYVARTEEYLGPYQADVLALETGTRLEGPPERGHPGPVLLPTVTIEPPRFTPRKEHRVAVFSARDERRVAVIELVSPGNKDSQKRADWFQRKLVEYLEGGLHLTLLDLLAPTNVVREGFAIGLVRALGSSEPLPHAGRCATSFECEVEPPRVRVYAIELQVGHPLPSAPLFLEPGVHVLVSLEATYEETVSRLPAPDRASLAGGSRGA